MYRFKTGVRILLVLIVINFALAAPIGVREISEVRVDVVDVARDGTTASQKRGEPSDQSSNDAPENAPLSPDVESEPQNPGSPTGSDSGPSKLTPSKRPHAESTGDFLLQGSSLTDDSPPRSSTKWSSEEYSPSWRKGPTEEYSPSWTKGSTEEHSSSWTEWSSDGYSPSWSKVSTGEHSPSWSKGSTDKMSQPISSTKWPSNEYSPSWTKGPTDEYSPSWSKASTDMFSPPASSLIGDSHPPDPGLTEDYPLPAPSNPGPKGSTDKSSPLSSSTKWSSDEYSLSWPKESTDEYSPSWTKASTEEYSPSWSKVSTDIYSPPTSSSILGDSHPPNPGLTEDHPLPAPSNPESSTDAHQSTNDYPPPPSPESQHPAAPESKDFFSELLKGKSRIPRHVSGSGAVDAAQRGW
jgi:hypothetical protein